MQSQHHSQFGLEKSDHSLRPVGLKHLSSNSDYGVGNCMTRCRGPPRGLLSESSKLCPSTTRVRRGQSWHVKSGSVTVRRFFVTVGLFLCLLINAVSASLTFLTTTISREDGNGTNAISNNPLVATSFDVYFLIRTPKTFNVTGSLTNTVIFNSNCLASLNTSRPRLQDSDIIHIHLPTVSDPTIGCTFHSDVVAELTKLYAQGNKFAAVLMTWDTEDDTGHEESPWGDPVVLRNTPFEIADAPLSTYITIMNFTGNYSIYPNVTLVSDMNPWTSLYRGTIALVYLSIYSFGLGLLFLYACWIHIKTFLATRTIVFNFKTSIYLCLQMFCSLQLMAYWIPEAFYVFFWFSYGFGFMSYCFVLLIWVRVINNDRSGSVTITKFRSNVIHLLTYFAISLWFTIFVFNVVADTYPQYTIWRAISDGLYWLIPISLIIHSGAFLYFGFRLMKILKTFKVTKEKMNLIQRMNILMTVDVALFFLFAVMTFVAIIFNRDWTGRLVSDICCAACALGLVVALFWTLYSSRDIKKSVHSSPGSAKKGTGLAQKSENGRHPSIIKAAIATPANDTDTGDEDLDEHPPELLKLYQTEPAASEATSSHFKQSDFSSTSRVNVGHVMNDIRQTCTVVIDEENQTPVSVNQQISHEQEMKFVTTSASRTASNGAPSSGNKPLGGVGEEISRSGSITSMAQAILAVGPKVNVPKVNVPKVIRTKVTRTESHLSNHGLPDDIISNIVGAYGNSESTDFATTDSE